MDEFESSLAAGHAANTRGEHRTVYQQLRRAQAHGELSTDDLGMLADAAFSCGNVKETLRLAEELYGRLLREDHRPQAAMKALSLGLMWVTRGDAVVGSGWINRARRILQTEPERAEHGFLIYLDAAKALDFHDTMPAIAAAADLERMGERLNQPVLTSLGLVLSGMADVREGRTTAGFAQLDEAMLPVLAENVPTEWAGVIYCSIIHLCHELADLQRMRAWTTATERWCEQFNGGVLYSGICRVHRLEMLSLEGGWNALEEELVDTATELEDWNSWAAADGFYQLGELRRRRGDYKGAAQGFARARELGIEPQPGEALLHAAVGRTDAAWSGLRAALDDADRLARARLLRAAIDIAIWHGMTEEADRMCAELESTAEEYASPCFRAWALHARAGALIAQDQGKEALVLLRSALRIYRDLHDQYDAAKVHELMAKAGLGGEEPGLADAHAASALGLYRQLGAEPDVARLAADTGPAGLTPRELEVLGCIAEGASNKAIAAELFISQKTVGRHIANIFVKLGVSSRTAAAAWFHEHGLSPARIRR